MSSDPQYWWEGGVSKGNKGTGGTKHTRHIKWAGKRNYLVMREQVELVGSSVVDPNPK
jgi:hypothetical protein